MTLMKSIRTLAALAPMGAFAATCGGHGPRESLFVSTQWLADHLKDQNLVVLAVGDEKDYKQAHIPGSVLIDYHQTHDMMAASGLNVEMLPLPVLAKYLAQNGVSSDSRIILYYLTDWFSPTG